MLKVRQCIRDMREYHSPECHASIDLRLDLNENTAGCSPRVLAKIHNLRPEVLARYQAREPGEKLVSDFLKLDASQVLLTNGADEGIDLLCRAYLEPGAEILVVTPAFVMYEIFAQTTGASIIRIPASADFGF